MKITNAKLVNKSLVAAEATSKGDVVFFDFKYWIRISKAILQQQEGIPFIDLRTGDATLLSPLHPVERVTAELLVDH